MMPVMPVGSPGTGDANGVVPGGTALPAAAASASHMPSINLNAPSRSDSLLDTDAPEEEIQRDRAQRHGKMNNFTGIANSSMVALAWRKQTAHQEDLEVCSAFK